MNVTLPFGHSRKLTVKVGRDLAYINWSRRVGPGCGRQMWLTAKDIVIWHRWS